jgi:hypothetical protein
VNIFVISKKTAYVPDKISALQSDYAEMWDDKENPGPKKSVMKHCEELYFKFVPKKFQSLNLALFGMSVISKFIYTKKKMYRNAPEFSKASKKRSK